MRHRKKDSHPVFGKLSRKKKKKEAISILLAFPPNARDTVSDSRHVGLDFFFGVAMPITMTCSCGANLRVADKAAGKTVTCPKCKSPIKVPLASTAEAETVAEAIITSKRIPHVLPLDEDYNEGVPVRRPRATSGTAAHSLGIASLVLGILAFIVSLIPCAGIIGLPIGGLALVLGIAGFIVALCRQGRGIGFPIAGSGVSMLAIIIALFWIGLLGTASHSINSMPSMLGRPIVIEPQDDPSSVMKFEDGTMVVPGGDSILFSEYFNNQAAADLKYTGKLIQFSHAVAPLWDYKPTKYGEKQYSLMFDRNGIGYVEAIFRSSEAEKLAAFGSRPKFGGPSIFNPQPKSNKRTIVTVRGRCRGWSSSVVTVDDAILVSVAEAEPVSAPAPRRQSR
jgi:hypothetical protein